MESTYHEKSKNIHTYSSAKQATNHINSKTNIRNVIHLKQQRNHNDNPFHRLVLISTRVVKSESQKVSLRRHMGS